MLGNIFNLTFCFILIIIVTFFCNCFKLLYMLLNFVNFVVCLGFIVKRVQFRFNSCQTFPIRRHSSTINPNCLNSSLKCPEVFLFCSKCFELIADRYILLLSPLLLFSVVTYSLRRRSNCSAFNAIRLEVNPNAMKFVPIILEMSAHV